MNLSWTHLQRQLRKVYIIQNEESFFLPFCFFLIEIALKLELLMKNIFDKRCCYWAYWAYVRFFAAREHHLIWMACIIVPTQKANTCSRHWCRCGVFIDNFELILYFFLVFDLLILNRLNNNAAAYKSIKTKKNMFLLNNSNDISVCSNFHDICHFSLKLERSFHMFT